MDASYYLVGLLCPLIVYLIYKLRKVANYFTDRNISYVKPIWPFGSDVKGSLFQDQYAKSWDTFYKRLEGLNLGGFYFFLTPVVMVRNPDYANRILSSDFVHFSDRGFYVDEKRNPLDDNLFFIGGEKWKYLRNKLTPIFTPEKLKWMFELMRDASDKFVNNYFETAIPFEEDVDLNETFARFATDVISSCAFGIESNALGEPDNKFREFGKKFFNANQWGSLFFLSRFLLHKVMSIFKLQTMDSGMYRFFYDVVQQAFHHRLSTGYVRKDFVQLLLELREKGHVAAELNSVEHVDEELKSGRIKIDDTVLTAQLFLFFLAGFETTTTTMNTLMYFLSQNPECQEKARKEAISVLESAGGTFTFESVSKLTYLQNCIDETLRINPPLPAHFRTCTKDYTFPDGTKIEAGAKVIIPFYSIQNDPQYFPDPEKFIPERFNEPIAQGTFIPFGGGQRICIGKRFALTEVKLTIAKILIKYKVKPSSTRCNPSKWTPMCFTIMYESPLYVRLEKIKTEA